MRDILNKSDIDQARRELMVRRREILARQADESQKLDAERAELETLNRLIDVFIQKLTISPAISHAPIASPIAAPVANPKTAGETAPAAAAPDQRSYPLTNFAAFTRAHSGE